MTTAADDFDALFDEAVAQNTMKPSADVAINFGLAPETNAADGAKPGSATDPENPMFGRLGGIVRLLHNSLRELGYDKAISDASGQILDAQDRLEYVATLTENAANKVLNALDEGMPAQDALLQHAKRMDARWADLFAGKITVDEFKLLAQDSHAFAQAVMLATDAEKARQLEIMMAQDFQDITGQLIKKVVAITKIVEGELAQLLRDNAPAALREKFSNKPEPMLQGPSIPTVAMDQGNVDDLLADLGF